MQCSECLLSDNQVSIAFVDISWRKWIQPTFSPMATGCSLNPALRHQERWDPTVLGTAKLKHRKSISWLTMHGGDVSKWIFMEFTIASNEIQHIVIRNSKLDGLRRSASRWTNQHRKTTPIAHRLRSSKDIRKIGISHWTNQAEMHRWNSDQTSEKHLQICTVSTVNLEKNELNKFLLINMKGGIRLLLPVPHGGSGMNTGGAHKLKNVNYLWHHGMSSVKGQETCFGRLLIKDTQSGFFDKMFLNLL